MMTYDIKKIDDESYLLSVSGRLDTMTAPQLEEKAVELLKKATKLTVDLENLEYISSAGLRVILLMQKTIAQKGTMKLIHVPQAVMEIFEITGFCDFLTIE